MNKMNITFGTDPELLLKERDTNQIVSAIPILKQGKENKINLGDGYYVYYDNVMLETNIPAANSYTKFIKNIHTGLKKIKSYVGVKHEIVAQASHFFQPEECAHEKAKEAGCNPEYCAYELEECLPPAFPDTFRSAGGHVHIGREDWDSASDKFLVDPFSKVNIIKAMDFYLGLPLMVIDNDPTSADRKKLYGRAGRHRVPLYGIEYRTPSNYWLRSPKLVEFICEASNLALELSQEDIDNFINWNNVISAINQNDKDAAQSLLKKHAKSDFVDYMNSFVDKEFNLEEDWELN